MSQFYCNYNLIQKYEVFSIYFQLNVNCTQLSNCCCYLIIHAKLIFSYYLTNKFKRKCSIILLGIQHSTSYFKLKSLITNKLNYKLVSNLIYPLSNECRRCLEQMPTFNPSDFRNHTILFNGSYLSAIMTYLTYHHTTLSMPNLINSDTYQLSHKSKTYIYIYFARSVL